MTIKSNNAQHHGFTLMELLLVIAILGVLSTMALSVMSRADDQARVAATQSRIKKIEAILQAELENYEFRQLPFRFNTKSDENGRVYLEVISQGNSVNFWRDPLLPYVPANVVGPHMRQRFIQDLIQVEFPQPLPRANGALDHPELGNFPSDHNSFIGVRIELDMRFRNWLNDTYVNDAGVGLGDYLRTDYPYDAANAPYSRPTSTMMSWANDRGNLELPAEYLYKLMHRIEFDGLPAIDSFGDNTVADTNGNRVLELVDAWGEPLLWTIVQVDVQLPEDPPRAVDVQELIRNESFPEKQNIDWTKRDSGYFPGMPQGFIPLDPLIPRDLSQIRIMVYSRRLNEAGIYSF